MFGFVNYHFSKESEILIQNIITDFRQTPIYSSYDIESFKNPNGVISLMVSKNGGMVNRFDFYSDNEKGKIGSIAIYGSSLKGHADAIKSSMIVFGLPVTNVSFEYDLVDVTLDDYDINTLEQSSIIDSLLSGNNYPTGEPVKFDSSDHIRYANGIDVSGHNYGCNRQIEIQKNIEGGEGYTVTIYNLDGIHPLWGNNVQMAPKQMRIIDAQPPIVGGSLGFVSLRGYGYDMMGSPYSDYAIDLFFNGKEIEKVILKMLDRNIELEYLK